VRKGALAGFVAGVRLHDTDDALQPSTLEQNIRDRDRARRRFYSKFFFIVVFGPLKAGKSTLTNAPAGEYVKRIAWQRSAAGYARGHAPDQ
jgi:hypothetical protein